MAGRGHKSSVLAVVLVACTLAAFCVQFLRSNAVKGFVGVTSFRGAAADPKIICRGIDKVMKDRIISVGKTAKMTDAMRMIAAAKVRKAQKGLEKAKPFGEQLTGMIKALVKKLKGSGLEQELPMLRVPEKVRKVAILVIGSNRGLCGPYNSRIYKRTARRVKQLNEEGIVPLLVSIGTKTRGKMPGRINGIKDAPEGGFRFNFTEKTFDMPDDITSETGLKIAEEISSLFLSGEADKVECIYTKFISLLESEANLKTVLPLSPTGIEDEEDLTFKMTSEDGKLKVERSSEKKKSKYADIEPDVIFDQPPTTILNSMLPLYLSSQILSSLYDSQASELASRMVAMKAATDNANEVKEKLTNIFNRKRQASITQDICEVAAGAKAQEKDDVPIGAPITLWEEDRLKSDFLRDYEDDSVESSPDQAAWAQILEAEPEVWDRR